MRPSGLSGTKHRPHSNIHARFAHDDAHTTFGNLLCAYCIRVFICKLPIPLCVSVVCTYGDEMCACGTRPLMRFRFVCCNSLKLHHTHLMTIIMTIIIFICTSQTCVYDGCMLNPRAHAPFCAYVWCYVCNVHALFVLCGVSSVSYTRDNCRMWKSFHTS